MLKFFFSTLVAAAGLSNRFHNDLLKNDEKFLLKEPIYVTDNWLYWTAKIHSKMVEIDNVKNFVPKVKTQKPKH